MAIQITVEKGLLSIKGAMQLTPEQKETLESIQQAILLREQELSKMFCSGTLTEEEFKSRMNMKSLW